MNLRVRVVHYGDQHWYADIDDADDPQPDDPFWYVDHCRSHLAREKVPEVVLFLDALPRNAMGKVVVTEIRGMMESTPRSA